MAPLRRWRPNYLLNMSAHRFALREVRAGNVNPELEHAPAEPGRE